MHHTKTKNQREIDVGYEMVVLLGFNGRIKVLCLNNVSYAKYYVPVFIYAVYILYKV